MITLVWMGYQKITTELVRILPAKAGVYKLSTYFSQTDKYKPFYIGQTSDISERTNQHMSDTEKNNCIKSNFTKYTIYINYALVTYQLDRDSVEVALYNHYTPECNDPNALPDVQPATVSSFN